MGEQSRKKYYKCHMDNILLGWDLFRNTSIVPGIRRSSSKLVRLVENRTSLALHVFLLGKDPLQTGDITGFPIGGYSEHQYGRMCTHTSGTGIWIFFRQD
jgi:hypothetical protein